jgi:hypothetical protein
MEPAARLVRIRDWQGTPYAAKSGLTAGRQVTPAGRPCKSRRATRSRSPQSGKRPRAIGHDQLPGYALRFTTSQKAEQVGDVIRDAHAVAAPMPDAAPVIMATLSVNSNIVPLSASEIGMADEIAEIEGLKRDTADDERAGIIAF